MTQPTSLGCVVWFTGLPGSGKTTIATLLQSDLMKRGRKVELLDGDEVRTWLSPNEGFSREDTERHLKRVAHICQLLGRNGIMVLASFVSPYRSTRDYACNTIENFVEVHVNCSLESCVSRDPKGLFYRKAAVGEIGNMTGTQDPYEEPPSPEIVLETEKTTPEQGARKVLSTLVSRGYLR